LPIDGDGSLLRSSTSCCHICGSGGHLLGVCIAIVTDLPSIALGRVGLLQGFAGHTTTLLDAISHKVSFLLAI